MSECMQFPDTWEEFEQSYGFEDKKEIYTNGSRLIQSFRVKQWLDHIAEPEQKTGEWIPFTMRELTDEEREENPEWDWVFTCKLPADGETVLLTNGKYVWEDMFCCDDGCYFDKADDIEDYDGYAWMPMPEPYRGDR